MGETIDGAGREVDYGRPIRCAVCGKSMIGTMYIKIGAVEFGYGEKHELGGDHVALTYSRSMWPAYDRENEEEVLVDDDGEPFGPYIHLGRCLRDFASMKLIESEIFIRNGNKERASRKSEDSDDGGDAGSPSELGI